MEYMDIVNFFTSRSKFNIKWQQALLISWALFLFLSGVNTLSYISIGNLISRVFPILGFTGFIILFSGITGPLIEEYMKLIVYRKLNCKSGLLVAVFLTLIEALQRSIYAPVVTYFMFIPSGINWYTLCSMMTVAVHVYLFFVTVFFNYTKLALITTTMLHGVFNILVYSRELGLAPIGVNLLRNSMYIFCTSIALCIILNKKYKLLK